MVNDKVSLKVNQGDIIGIIGESGCGKSTLAKILLGIEEKSKGQILFEGNEITKKTRKNFKKDIQIIFQNPISALNPKMTVTEIVAEPLLLSMNYRKNKDEILMKVKKALQYANLEEKYYNRKVSQLSGGQCQRIAIARALVTTPKLLICDEITSALDVSNQYNIIEILKKYVQENNITVIFITHNIQLAKILCNRIVVMKDGKIVEENETQKIFEMPQHDYTKMLINL